MADEQAPLSAEELAAIWEWVAPGSMHEVTDTHVANLVAYLGRLLAEVERLQRENAALRQLASAAAVGPAVAVGATPAPGVLTPAVCAGCGKPFIPHDPAPAGSYSLTTIEVEGKLYHPACTP